MAEGDANPLSISTSDVELKEWLASFIGRRFGFKPTVEARERGFRILLGPPALALLGPLASCSAADKFVPNGILNAPDDIVEHFLAGYLENNGYPSGAVEVVARSERLALELAYLMARLGIHITLRHGGAEGERYFRLLVAGEDRAKIARLPFRKRRYEIDAKDSSHGYPGIVMGLARRIFGSVVGRGGRIAELPAITYRGDALRRLLSKEGWRGREVVGRETLESIIVLFEEMAHELSGIRAELGERSLTDATLKGIYRRLPFHPEPVLTKRLGIAKSSVRDYVAHGLPRDEGEREAVRKAILLEVEERMSELEDGIRKLRAISALAWDSVSDIREESYGDYVYDFSVPGAANFVGGNLPTILHNSQLCMQLCVNVQLPRERGGLKGGALYVDTEHTFRTERIVQMAKHLGLDPREAVKNIVYAEAFTSDHQMFLLDHADEVIKEHNIRLIVIDSLTAHFRSEYVGRDTLAERQQKLNRHLHKLIRLARAFNAVAVVTNQVMARPDVFFGDAVAPIGGHVVAHTSHTRMYLRKGKGRVRVARLVSSPYLPEGEAVFKITENGIEDVEEGELPRGKL